MKSSEPTLERRTLEHRTPEPSRVNERVHLRVISFPCCGHQLCWISQRLPSYCPECGKLVYLKLKEALTTGNLLVEDAEATLRYKYY